MKYIAVIVAVFAVFVHSEAKQFTRCQLVRELRKHGLPEAQLRNWVCLVEHESSRITNKIGKVNKNGSRDYGLFQINDKYWCSKTSTPGNECNVTCNDLLSDDITKAVNCAKKVHKRQGFNAWYGWRNHCQGTLPEISSC